MDLPDLDPVIHQRTRLQVMTLLYRNRQAALAWVRGRLDLTYGNLDSHASRLEEEGYLERGRVLTPDGFEVKLTITDAGDEAFAAYLEAMRAYQDRAEDAPSTDEED